jgi:hypothetical protein
MVICEVWKVKLIWKVTVDLSVLKVLTQYIPDEAQ